MKILALEWSSSHKSVAILEETSGTILAAATDETSQAIPVFPLIDRALKQAGLTPSQIDRLAVGIGPGSYTGIRVALSVAQGWHAARQTPILAVPTHHVLAQQVWESGYRGPFAIAVDAQRQEYYFARFEATPAGWKEVHPLQLVSAESLRSFSEPLYGPDLQSILPQIHPFYPAAQTLAFLACKQSPVPAPHLLQPIYLRKPTFRKAPPPRFPIED